MSPRVLIVDDQREISRLLRSALETIEQGLQVAEAPSGEEAILDSVRHRVDLLVADFRLPGISGIELMRKLKVRNPDLKVILITGVTDPRAREEIARAGADAYFTKPVPMADFLDAVERSLGMVRTIMPAAPVQEPVEKIPAAVIAAPVERKTLPDLMVTLRQEMSAQVVALLNERGVIKAQAGELPAANPEVSLIAALMSVHSAAQKVSSLLGNHPNQHVHLFKGEKLDLVFAPLGPLHTVLVAGKDVAAPDKWAQHQKMLETSQGEIVAILDKMGVTGQLSAGVVEAFEAQQAAKQAEAAAAEVVPAPEVEEDADFGALFGALDKPGGVDLNAFWDDAAEKGANFVLRDTISFEEASKLGLAPDAKS